MDLLPERKLQEQDTPGNVQTGGKCAEESRCFCALR